MGYRIVVSGLEIMQGSTRLYDFLSHWLNKSVFPSAHVRKIAYLNQDAAAYQVYFDSSTWTGRKA